MDGLKLNFYRMVNYARCCKYLFLVSAVTMLAGCAESEDIPKPETQHTQEKDDGESDFILPGYRVKWRATGDLNNDGLEDIVLVLTEIKETKPTTHESGPPKPLRPLILLLRQNDNSLALARRNDTAIMCFYCGGSMGDPVEHIAIKAGRLDVHHYGGTNWRWTSAVSFAYDTDQQNWMLEKIVSSSFHAFGESFGETKTVIKTPADFGAVTLEDFNIYDMIDW